MKDKIRHEKIRDKAVDTSKAVESYLRILRPCDKRELTGWSEHAEVRWNLSGKADPQKESGGTSGEPHTSRAGLLIVSD